MLRKGHLLCLALQTVAALQRAGLVAEAVASTTNRPQPAQLTRLPCLCR